MNKKYLNRLSKLAILTAVISFTSCREEGGLAPEYMPDMYRSPSIETYVDYGELRGNYSDTTYTNKITARLPVEGTIHRGFMPYAYENTPEGYESAGQNLKNPIVFSDDAVSDGKALYAMFCVHCHGKTGQGDGTIVQRGKFPPIPVKFAPALDLPEGKMFHTITYGKGLMGSHAPQLNKEEIWKLVHFIRAKFMEKVPAQLDAPEVAVAEVEGVVAEAVDVAMKDKGTEKERH
jgi:mono/diheme cytochrome c family protein